MFNIYSLIRQEIDNFLQDSIEIVPGYSFNQFDTIKKAHLYSVSRYVNDELYCGRKKLFYNIVNPACMVETRYLNFDTKDIRLIPQNAKSEIGTMFLQKELKQWLKDKNFSKILNGLAEKAPKYGSVVLKKTKTGASVVDLRKLVLDQTVDCIQNSSHIVLEYQFTPDQLRKKAKENGWENVDEAIKHFSDYEQKTGYIDSYNRTQVVTNKHIRVWERYGEIPERWLSGDMSMAEENEKKVKALIIVAGVRNQTQNAQGQNVWADGVILFKGTWKNEWPFKDYHRKKIEGRWLGLGVIEEMFIAQERINELANQKRVSMELSSKHIFQTADRTVLKSVLNDVENGSILVTGPNGGIQPLANEERNLSAFSMEESRWDNLGKSLSFSYDAVRGEALPSSTPATNAVIQDRNATSVFGFMRENLAIMLRSFFTEWVMPQLVKDLTPKHMLLFTGGTDEFMKLDQLIIGVYVRDIAMKRLLSGIPVTQEMVDMYAKEAQTQLKKRGAQRWFEIKDNMYSDLEYQFDILVTNEQEDMQVMSQNLIGILQSLKNVNLQDPLQKTLFMKYLEKVGISPAEIELASQARETMTQMEQPGQMPGMPQMQQQQQQIRQ